LGAGLLDVILPNGLQRWVLVSGRGGIDSFPGKPQLEHHAGKGYGAHKRPRPRKSGVA
jgi:hypothetical protein